MRWNVRITYRRDHGSFEDAFIQIEELDELAGVVEHGPHWDTISRITIERSGGDKTLTVEAAAKL